ncbi:MAG: TonB family protein [Candidatus Korobacteraceae bacterium]
MPSILIPPDTPSPPPPDAKESGRFELWTKAELNESDLTPHILIQLEDDIERSRMREAFWISVVVHMALVIFLVMTPKMFPGVKGVVLLSPADIMRNQQLTYLDLPPDAQKPPKTPPESKVLSDKNRIAESRHPSLDKKTLEELKRAGPPAAAAPPGQTGQMTAPPQQGTQQQPSQGQQMAQLQNAFPTDNPRLPTPQQGTPKVPDFRAGLSSPGSQIQQSADAVASRRGGTTYGGGDYGMGPGGSARTLGNLEVLSDTQGVDFGPYLSRVLEAVRRNWYILIPEEARAPLMKRGRLAIEFVILQDGKVAGMKLVSPSGDVSLDRAAWGGITGSNPFAPLPGEFHGPYLALRFRFYYNPQKGDMD